MPWNDNMRKVAVKAIGSVESNMDYAAINYNDPITIGIAQWYGTRAASFLKRYLNAVQWKTSGMADTPLDAALKAHDENSSYWNTYYLDRSMDAKLRSFLRLVALAQDVQIQKDIEGYSSVAKQYGLDIEGNTEAFIMWATAYHQSPRQALRVLQRNGGNLGLSAMHQAILADSVLGQYKNRYNKVFQIISSGDISGVGSGNGSSGSPIGNGGFFNSNGVQSVGIDGGEIVLRTDNTDAIYFNSRWGNAALYPCGINTWKIELGKLYTNIQIDVPDQPDNPGGGGGGGGGGGAGDGSAGAKALQWMRSRIMKFTYLQAPGRLDPDRSGFGDCSSTIYRAYKDTSGINVGTWTGDQYFRGRAVIERGRGAMTAAQKAMCRPGDVIVMSWGGGYPHTDHVEMFVDEGHTIGHGGPNRGPHINSIGMLSGTAWWTVRRHG